MINTCHAVKGADRIGSAVGSKMYINGSRIQGFMPKEGLDCEKIRTIFIEMGTKSVAERVAGKAMVPAKSGFPGKKGLIYGVRNHVLFGVAVLRKKPTHRSAAGSPVIGKDLESKGRKNGVAVRAALGVSDMNAHAGPGNILITEGTDLTNAEACGIHKSKNSLVFQVLEGMNKKPDFFL